MIKCLFYFNDNDERSLTVVDESDQVSVQFDLVLKRVLFVKLINY